ncbi:MAG: hypothetical protein DRJ07_20720 [Bacteroidetes bacterium]|nr:MAG: hypothetical protein DRJ07_20720 [Bacteroidota bacterium]
MKPIRFKKTSSNMLTIVIILAWLNSCSILNITPSKKIHKISFENIDNKEDCDFIFSDTTNNEYLKKFRNEYKINELTREVKTDLEKIFIVLNWTNSRWEHSGSNTPKKSDAFTILEEAKQGNSFRCVEYGIVAATALNSIGISARTLGLKTKDVEKTRHGAGHVVTEAYLNNLEKWIFIDGQMNLIPFLDDKPLNAVEFQKAIFNNKEKIQLRSINKIADKNDSESYIKWVGRYLYFFSARFDNRENYETNKIKCKDKSSLMLVPIGAKNPQVFQKKHAMDYLIYTNSYTYFYKEPKFRQ